MPIFKAFGVTWMLSQYDWYCDCKRPLITPNALSQHVESKAKYNVDCGAGFGHEIVFFVLHELYDRCKPIDTVMLDNSHIPVNALESNVSIRK